MKSFSKGGNSVAVRDSRRTYEVKDGEHGMQTTEPEVVTQVLAEVKRIGATSKESHAEAMRLYADVKKTLDAHGGKLDALDAAKVNKQIEDITTRQQKADEEATKRIDALDLSLQRIGKQAPASEVASQLIKDASDFKLTMAVLTGEAKGREMDELREELAQSMKTDEFMAYRKAFRKYLRRDEAGMSHEELKAMSVGSDPDGGVTVTPFMSARIVEKVFEGDPFRQLCNIETIGTDALELTEDLDEAGDGWEGETVVGAETTTPQLKKKRIQVHNQYARPRATQKLLEDSSINIEQWLANKVGQKFLRTEGAAFVTGDGIMRPRGFLTYANGTAYGQVEQTALGAAATITTDGLIDLQFSLLEEYLMRATWAMNRLTVASIMKLKDGDGQYIWRPGILAGQPSTLLGLPMRMSTTMPIVAANALSLAIADWNEFYTIVDRLGITVQRDPFTVKPFVEFYTRRRVGGDVVNFQAGKIGVVSV